MVNFKIWHCKLYEFCEHLTNYFTYLKIYLQFYTLISIAWSRYPFLAHHSKNSYLDAINIDVFKSMPRLRTSVECRGSQECQLLKSLPLQSSVWFILHFWLVSTLSLSFIESRGWQHFPMTSTFTPKLVFIGPHYVHYKATCLVGSSKWELRVSLFFTVLFWLTSILPPPNAGSVEETTSKR